MTLYIKRLWSDTPPLRPQQADQLLDLYHALLRRSKTRAKRIRSALIRHLRVSAI